MKGNNKDMELTNFDIKEGGIFLDKDDVGILIGTLEELVSGLSDGQYDRPLSGLYEGTQSIEERMLRATDFVESNYTVTSGVLNLTRFVLSKLEDEWENVVIKPH